MDVADLEPEPMHQVSTWLDAARAAGEPMPEAMAVATATADGVPSVRMLILRGTEGGITFFTDADSDKGADLSSNPRAAVVLHWLLPVHRQVRVTGAVERTGEAEADDYWRARPHHVRLSAAALRQDSVVPDRAALQAAFGELRARYPEGTHVPRPQRWCGFRVVAERVELWEEAPDALHDRFLYHQDGGGWVRERLAP